MRRQGMTLVEILMAIALGASLLLGVGGLVWTMSRLAAGTTGDTRAVRQLEFCLETLRKECQEIRREPGNPEYELIGGDGFLSYVTSRVEVIARGEVPRGSQRVEWRFEPEEGTLVRRVFRLAGPDREAGRAVSTVLLTGLRRLSFWRWEVGKWRPMTGMPVAHAASGAIRIEMEFQPSSSPVASGWVSTAVAFPHG